MNTRHLTRGALTALLLLAFALRVVGILTVPPGLSGDEAINGSDALNVWRWGQTPIFFTNNYGREAGFLYLMALSIRLLGPNVLAIRLPAVICGMGGLACSYVLLRRLWNTRVALLAIALMSVSLWPIFESRIGLRAISMLPLQALALYALRRGLTSQRGARPSGWIWWILLGVTLGLLPYTYIPGRIFPAVVVVWIATTYLTRARCQDGALHRLPSTCAPLGHLRDHLPGLLAAAALALAIFAPFGWFILQHPEQANQRVNELSSLLNSARASDGERAGDLRPLLTNAVETLKMFTVRGDEHWRYNVADRPVFDPVTGAFFYLGIAISLARIRQPRHQLLLIWMLIMLMPSALAGGTPSFLRSTGALIPIYVAPAIAADAVGTWLVRRASRAIITPEAVTGSAPAEKRLLSRVRGLGGAEVRTVTHACLLIGLGIIAAREGVAYFVVWPNTPRVREIYTAGLAQVGRHLSARASDGGAHAPSPPAVLVGADFAADYSREMVGFQTTYTGPIRWLVGRHAMVVPGIDETPGELLYLFADTEPPGEIAAPVLEKAELVTYATASDGRFESSAYRLLPESRVSPPWQPEVNLDGRFEGALEIVGYDLPRSVARGESVTLNVYWRVPESFAVDRTAALWFSVKLRDVEGNVWDERANLLPYASWEWHPGDWVAQQIAIPVAADLPPGELFVDFSIEKNQAALPYTTDDGGVASTVRMGPVIATGHPAAAMMEGATTFGEIGEIALERTLMVGVATPGDPLRSIFYWRAIARPSADYRVHLRILNPDCLGDPVHTLTLPLWEESYPTSQWVPGEAIRSFHHPPLPRDLPEGRYGVAVSLIAPDAEEITTAADSVCLRLEIRGYVRRFTLPEMDVRIDRTLSDGITLVGYTVTPAPPNRRPSEPVTVTLIWQAEDEPSNAYTVFTHLYGPDGQLIAQHDGTPCAGICPTHAWLAGEVIVDTHILTLPDGATLCEATDATTCTLGVGMYDLPTLTRLAILETQDNVLLLPWPTGP